MENLHQNQYYHYTSAEAAVKVLENRTIRFSSIKKLNDPFDVRIRVLSSQNFRLKRFFQLLVDEIEKSEIFASYFSKLWLPDFEWRNLSEAEIERRYMIIPWQGYLNNLCQKTVKVTEKHDRFFCCSLRPDIPSMWAHYADQYSGVVLVFNDCNSKKEGLFNEKTQKLDGQELRVSWNDKIEYKPSEPLYFNERKIIQWFNACIKTDREKDSTWTHENIVLPSYFTKSKHWEYENEYRFARFLSPEHPQINSDYYYESIPESNINSIILGNGIEPWYEEYIKKILKGYKITVKILKIVGLDRGYKFKFCEI